MATHSEAQTSPGSHWPGQSEKHREPKNFEREGEKKCGGRKETGFAKAEIASPGSFSWSIRRAARLIPKNGRSVEMVATDEKKSPGVYPEATFRLFCSRTAPKGERGATTTGGSVGGRRARHGEETRARPIRPPPPSYEGSATMYSVSE